MRRVVARTVAVLFFAQLVVRPLLAMPGQGTPRHEVQTPRFTMDDVEDLKSRLIELIPATDEDRLPIRVQALRTKEGNVAIRVGSAAPTQGDASGRYAWAVDLDNGTFSAVALAGDATDVERVQRFRQRIGRPLTPDKIQKVSSLFKDWDMARARARHSGWPSPETAIASAIDGASGVSETNPEGGSADRRTSCYGAATVMIGVEDPVGIDVTDTYTYSSWWNDDQYVYGSGNPECDAKSAFGWIWGLDTQWYTDSCQFDARVGSDWFDHRTAGQYENWDFGLNYYATGSFSLAASNFSLAYGYTWDTYAYSWGEFSWLLSGGYSQHDVNVYCN